MRPSEVAICHIVQQIRCRRAALVAAMPFWGFHGLLRVAGGGIKISDCMVFGYYCCCSRVPPPPCGRLCSMANLGVSIYRSLQEWVGGVLLLDRGQPRLGISVETAPMHPETREVSFAMMPCLLLRALCDEANGSHEAKFRHDERFPHSVAPACT